MYQKCLGFEAFLILFIIFIIETITSKTTVSRKPVWGY